MRRKLWIGIALLLCLATLLVSCGSAKQLKFSKVINKEAFRTEQKAFSSVTKMDVKGEITQSGAILAVFSSLGDTGLITQTVYNLSKGAVVLTTSAVEATVGETVQAKTQEIDLMEYRGTEWFYVTETTVSTNAEEVTTSCTITMYQADGTSVAKATRSNLDILDIEAPVTACDLIFFDGVCYRIHPEKGIEKAFDFSELREIPQLTHKVDDRYYYMENGTLRIYDEDLNQEVFYWVPDYAEEQYIMEILDNGDVFVQYETLCNDQEETYSYVNAEGEKYLMTALLIDCKSGKQKDLKLDFVVAALSCAEMREEAEYRDYDDGIKNLGWIYFIEDRRIDTTLSSATLVSLSNSMKIKGEIDGYVPGKVEAITAVGPDRWCVVNSEGQSFLLNKKGKVLGDITNGTIESNLGIVVNKKIYNWDLELLYDLNEQEAVIYWTFDECVLFENTSGEIRLYANGETRTLIGKDDTKTLELLGDAGFMIMNYGDSTFKLYNLQGKEIFSSGSDASYQSGATVAMNSGSEAVLLVPIIDPDSPNGAESCVYFLIK